MNYKGYKELESYIKARELRITISDLVKQFPNSEKFLLTNQIIRFSLMKLEIFLLLQVIVVFANNYLV